MQVVFSALTIDVGTGTRIEATLESTTLGGSLAILGQGGEDGSERIRGVFVQASGARGELGGCRDPRTEAGGDGHRDVAVLLLQTGEKSEATGESGRTTVWTADERRLTAQRTAVSMVEAHWVPQAAGICNTVWNAT